MPIIDSPDFGHAFVPIDSLTSSPRSSTGSTSVLEWNSSSGSEGFSVHSLDHCLSSPTSPHISPPLSSNPPSPKEILPDHDHDQIFGSFTSAAPRVDSVSDTVTSDTFADEYRNLLSALGERLTLQDSVTQWQNHSYRETAGLDRPETPSAIKLPDDAVYDKEDNNIAPSPDRSVTTDSSISAVTAKPSLHVSSLFLPPVPPTSQVYPASLSVVSDHSESESISIAQYFQLKAAKADEAEPLVQPPVDGPPRPISAASCLSYASSAESPVPTPAVTVPLPDRGVETPLRQETWHDLVLKVGKDSSSTTYASCTALPRPQCTFTYPETSSYRESTYSPHFGSSTVWNCFLDPPSSSFRKSQMENNDTGSQFNPFTIKVSPPSPQGTDTQESNLKGHGTSKATTWPIPPVIPCGTSLLKPTTPCLDNSHGRQPPTVVSPYDSFYGHIPKWSNRPVPPLSQAPSSACQVPSTPALPLPSPWSNGPRTRDIGLASPESTDSGRTPLPSTPSVPSVSRWPSPTPSGSMMSGSAIPPSPPQVNFQPAYLRHATAKCESNGPPSNVPYVMPPTPGPAPPYNGEYTSTQRSPRALPIPSIPRQCSSYTQAPYTPRYTGSTLPRDMHLSAGPPTWGPTPRRLRFAPLPPTPSAGLHYTGNPSSTLPYTTPLPPYPLNPMPYPYQPPASQVPPPVSTPYCSWRAGGAINSSQHWTAHPVFWYSDGSIVFHIENVGYKVHRHFFQRHSAYFRDLLAYPTYAINPASPYNIYLSDVKKVDFERLLLIFYPSNLVDRELFTVEEWTSILTLSDKWNFAQLKTLATRELGYITSTIEKIALAKKYNIGNPQWLLAAYRELCTRRHPLSLVEGEKLGLETVIKIWEVQHELTMGTSTWGQPVDIVIQDKFGLL